MSRTMTPAQAAAATAAAVLAEAAARNCNPGRIVRERLAKTIAENAGRQAQSLPGATWAAMPQKVRAVVVMLGATASGDPMQLARQPWESFTEADRDSMAACARDLRAGLAGAPSLF